MWTAPPYPRDPQPPSSAQFMPRILTRARPPLASSGAAASTRRPSSLPTAPAPGPVRRDSRYDALPLPRPLPSEGFRALHLWFLVSDVWVLLTAALGLPRGGQGHRHHAKLLRPVCQGRRLRQRHPRRRDAIRRHQVGGQESVRSSGILYPPSPSP